MFYFVQMERLLSTNSLFEDICVILCKKNTPKYLDPQWPTDTDYSLKPCDVWSTLSLLLLPDLICRGAQSISKIDIFMEEYTLRNNY